MRKCLARCPHPGPPHQGEGAEILLPPPGGEGRGGGLAPKAASLLITRDWISKCEVCFWAIWSAGPGATR